MALVSREGSEHWGSHLPHAPEESGGGSTVGGGLGTPQDCHSKLGVQHRHPGTYPTPDGGQTGMGGADSNNWNRVGGGPSDLVP